MKNKSLLTHFCLGASVVLTFNQSLASNSTIEWNGYLDFYYQSSPQAHPSTATAGPKIVEGRFFDKHVNQMTISMAEISFKKKSGKVLFKTDIAFGEMVDQLSGGSSQQNPNLAANEPTRNITQAMITYTASDRLSVTAGKFYTPVGLEVAKAKDNMQYSRSYTYNYGVPFWHEGLSATFVAVPENFLTTIYLVNSWDGRISQEQNQATTVVLNFNYIGVKDLVANYNYLVGAEAADGSQRELHEVNLTYTLNPTFSFAADFVAGDQKNIPVIDDVKWNGAAVYMKAIVNDVYSISPRYELFDDSDQGFAIAGGLSSVSNKQKITSVTLANNFNLGDGLETRLELRSDKSDSDLYFKDKNGAQTDRQESYTLGLLYSF